MRRRFLAEAVVAEKYVGGVYALIVVAISPG